MATQQGNLQRIIPALFTGRGGQLMTPDQIAREREIAAALMAPNQQPITNWADGAAGLVDAFSGKMREGRANQASDRNAANSQRIQQALFGSMGSGSAPSMAPAFSPQAAIGGVQTGMSGPAASVPTGDRASYIRQGLVQRGLPEHVADAFIVNFQDESGLNPGINEAKPLVPGSRGGYGLYQLTGPRRRQYEAFAQSQGIPLDSIDGQLDFLVSELQGSEARAGQSILSAPDTASAAQAIVNNFLRPAPEHRQSRSARYARLGNSEPVQVASLDPSAGMASALQSEPQEAMRSGSVAQALFGPTDALAQPPQQVAQALMPQQPYAAPQQAAQPYQPSAPAPINPAILEALSSPYVDDQTRQIGMMLFQQEQQAQAAQAQAVQEWNALQEQRQYDFGLTQEQRGYDRFLTGDQRAYDRTLRNEDFAREDARNLFLDTRQAGRDQRVDFESDRNFGLAEQGLTPTSVREYEYNLENPGFAQFEQDQRRAGAVNVNLPGQPNIGTIPPGYEAIQDPQSGGWSMRPIPGGPAALDAERTANAAGNKQDSTERYGNVVLQDIDRALEIIKDGGWLPVTGAGSSWAASFGGTQANDLRALLDTVKSNSTFDRLQAMRDASPTGAALGAVSDTELGLLQAAIGSLDQSQSEAQLKRNLERVRDITDEIVNGVVDTPAGGDDESLDDLLGRYGS